MRRETIYIPQEVEKQFHLVKKVLSLKKPNIFYKI